MNNTDSNHHGDTPLHPSVQNLLDFFAFEHLPPRLQAISRPCCELAKTMAYSGLDGAELTVGLRKLLEAKDCFVRAELSKKEGKFQFSSRIPSE